MWLSFFYVHLGAGPASSASLVRLATCLLASTRVSFGSDGVDQEEDTLVVSEIVQQKLNLDDIYVLTLQI